MMFEKGQLGSYFDGSFSDTTDYDYAWTGTSDASTSTRAKLRRKNFVQNPSVQNGTVGWAGSSATVSADSTVAHLGTQSLKLVASSTASVEATVSNTTDIQGIASKERMCASVWVLTNDTGVSATIQLYNGLTSGPSAVALTPGVWTKLSLTNYAWDGADTTTSTRALRVQFTGMTAGKTMWVDEALLEPGSVLGEYFDGSMTDTATSDYSWAGTANASVSIETPVVGTYSATSSFVFAPANPADASNLTRMLPAEEGSEYSLRATVSTDVAARIGWRVRLFMKDGTVTSSDITPFPSVSGKRLVDSKYIIPADVVAWYPELTNLDNTDTITWKVYGGAAVRLKAAGHLIVDGSITADKLAANSVTAGKILAGEINATHLTSQLVLASEIVAGPVNGTHASMKPDGFRVYTVDSVSGELKEAVRLGVAGSDDYFSVQLPNGNYASTISHDGVVYGKVGNFDDIKFGGRDMQTVLDQYSKGIVAWGQAQGNQLPNVSNGQERGLFELAFTPSSNRMYAFSCSPVLYTPTGGVATAAALKVRYTTDGSQPTTSSTLLAEDYKPILVNGSWTHSYQITDRLIGGFNGSYIRILVTMVASNGNGLTAELGQAPTFVVKDIGPAYPQSGVISQQVSGSSSSQTVVVTKETYFGKVDQRSYLSNNNLYNYDTARMYQGQQPGTGNQDLRSAAFFNSMTGELSGATIHDMQVYVYFDHWYYNSGGTARIGLHGYVGAVPSTFPGTTWILDSGGWPKPGGRWLTIPSAYWDGFKSGTYRGITLGVNANTLTNYGIASDAKIYVRYTK